MPRDAGGNFSLVAGNPVISGTTISTTWGNDTMDDLAQGLTDSLDRLGRGGMLAPFLFADGSTLAPGMAWNLEPTTGFYRAGAGDMRMTLLNQDVTRWNAGNMQVWDGAVFRTVIYATGPGSVPPGNADGQTLGWDETTDQAWVLSTTLVANNTIGLVTAFESSNARVWAISDSTVLHVERAADVAINLAGGSINQGIINFGDAEAENTGQIIYDHLLNQMEFWTNTTKRINIDLIGRVGIGTDIAGGFWGASGPETRLHVLSSDSETDFNVADVQLVLTNDDLTTGNHTKLVFGALNTGGSGIAQAAIGSVNGVRGGGFNAGELALYYANTGGSLVEGIRLAATGFVGIGTATPDRLLTLGGAGDQYVNRDVEDGSIVLAGGGGISGGFSAGGFVARGSTSGFNTAGLELYAGGFERMRVTEDGIVTGLFTGVGISQSLSKFEVVSSLPGTPDDDTIYFVV